MQVAAKMAGTEWPARWRVQRSTLGNRQPLLVPALEKPDNWAQKAGVAEASSLLSDRPAAPARWRSLSEKQAIEKPTGNIR